MTLVKNVVAILVTYNRIELLKQSLEAILEQTYKVNKIIVINNNSTDGTRQYLETTAKLESKLLVVNSERNLGGAGGFTLGIEKAIESSTSDFLWVMDDDTIPSPTALEAMISATEKKPDFGFLCSEVHNIDGAPMNVPMPAHNWNEPLADGLVRVQEGTFVSILLNVAALRKVGLPIKEFFIWFDDLEFTRRISKTFNSYYVIDSHVLHKTKGGKNPDIVTDGDRIPRYYYYYRNKFFVDREFGGKIGIVKYTLNFVLTLLKVISKANHKSQRIRVMLRGAIAGIRFHPQPARISS